MRSLPVRLLIVLAVLSGLVGRAGANTDTLRLYVSITQQEDAIFLNVTPISGTARGSVTLPVVMYRDGTEFPSPVTVATTGDRVRLATIGALDNVMVRPVSSDIEVVESKPGRFWLYQLRTSADSERRLAAAAALAEATDVPDLALALSGLYRQEPDPHVRIALLSSYAVQSRGRTGSHPLLLNALRETTPVRLAAMSELSRYVGVEPVRNAVLDVIRNSDDVALVNRALTTYRAIVPQAEADDLMRRLLNEDDTGDFALTILGHFQGREEARLIRQRLPLYVEPTFPFELRKSALKILTEQEKAPSFWRDVFESHVSDADPRFRLLIWDAAAWLADEDRERLLRNRLDSEEDPAVRSRLQGLNP